MSVIYQTRIEGNFEIKRVNLMKWFNSVFSLLLCFYKVICMETFLKPITGLKVQQITMTTKTKQRESLITVFNITLLPNLGPDV